MLTTADLGTDLVGGRIGRPQHDLDLLGGALTDRDAVLADVPLNRIVDVERPDADRLKRNDTAKRDQRRFGGAATDVDHHVAHRLIDGQICADRRRNRLLDEPGIGGTRPPSRLGHRPPLDRRDGGRHTDHHSRPVEPTHTDPLQQEPNHSLRHVEVGDCALTQRPHRNDVGRGPANHLPRLMPHRQHLARPTVERDNGRLVQDDALTPGVDQRIGRPQIDGEVACQVQFSSTGGSSSRTIPLGCGWGCDRWFGAIAWSRSWNPGSTGRRDRAHSHNNNEPAIAANSGKTKNATALLMRHPPHAR